MRGIWLAGIIALVLAYTTASAQARNDIGFLTCNLAESEEAQSDVPGLVSRTREVLCSFSPVNSGSEETYAGTLQTLGQDPEAPSRAMIWVVRVSSHVEISPGMLGQVYAAEPAATPGQAPSLVGETNKLIVLQSMVEKERPASAGSIAELPSGMIVVVALKLKSAPT